MQLWRRSLVSVIVFWCLAISVFAQDSLGPSMGKWKLNVAKTKFDPGPVYKSELRTYEDWGGGLIRAVFDGIDAEGKPTHREYVARLDGRDYPWARRGAQTSWTIALKPAGPRSFEFIAKEDGKISYTGTHAVSEDGKVTTITYKGTNAQGQPVGATMVYDKQ